MLSYPKYVEGTDAPMWLTVTETATHVTVRVAKAGTCNSSTHPTIDYTLSDSIRQKLSWYNKGSWTDLDKTANDINDLIARGIPMFISMLDSEGNSLDQYAICMRLFISNSKLRCRYVSIEGDEIGTRVIQSGERFQTSRLSELKN